ncbi:MAG TPA: lipid-A-disaccharide synthase [Caulobacteraceae bacterium]|nr:lipid-A-disaccharide synthase [Caulobacteraceae bacterium]
MSAALRVMLVAAEASGDALGAGLARALKQRLGDQVSFVGVGGTQMAAEGVQSPFDIAELSILGLFEGLMAYAKVVRRADQTAALAETTRPDVAVLIDSWGFTLRVAQRLRRRLPGLPLVKYVGPQVWASRPGRARTLAATVDLLLAQHPFDAPYFEAEGLKTVFVGSAALQRDFSGADPARLRAHIGASADEPILLVLPGSRPGEIARVGPPFGEAVDRLAAARPGLKVVIPVAGTVAGLVRAQTAGWRHRPVLIEDEGLKADALRAGTLALACSGTATTELAMAGCPMVVGYRLGAATHAVLRRLIRTPYVVLLNIAAGEMIVPERIQGQCTGAILAADLAARLDDPALRAAQVAAQNAALDKMGRGQGDPAGLAAEAVLAIVRKTGGGAGGAPSAVPQPRASTGT